MAPEPFQSGITAAGTLRLLATACLAQSARRGAIPILDAASGRIGQEPTYLGPCGVRELRGAHSAPARVGQAGLGRFQQRVAEMSVELTSTSIPF